MTPAERVIVRLVEEGYLKVEANGSIWRMRAVGRTGRIREVRPVRAENVSNKGYSKVKVRIEGMNVEASAHRIIWICLYGEISENKEINHIDGARSNNHPSNLEVVSHGENQTHSYAHLNRPRMVGIRNGQARLSETDARAILHLKGSVSSREAGRRFGVSHFAVQRIWSGVGWTHLSADAMPEVRS